MFPILFAGIAGLLVGFVYANSRIYKIATQDSVLWDSVYLDQLETGNEDHLARMLTSKLATSVFALDTMEEHWTWPVLRIPRQHSGEHWEKRVEFARERTKIRREEIRRRQENPELAESQLVGMVNSVLEDTGMTNGGPVTAVHQHGNRFELEYGEEAQPTHEP